MTAQASDDLGGAGWQAWAENLDCDGLSDAHITSGSVSVVDGLLTVNVTVQSASTNEKRWSGVVCVSDQEWTPVAEIEGDTAYYDWLESSAVKKEYTPEDSSKKSGGTYQFTLGGLTVGKTYYVYCAVFDTHDESVESCAYGVHYAVCLGSGAPTAASAPSSGSSGGSSSSSSSSGSSSASASISYEETVATQIEAAPSGSTVVMENGISALSNSTMKELLAKGDVSLRMEFTYQDKEYVIIIPAGAALDNDIPWYGPLYLAQHFGNSAGSAGSEAGVSYEVKSGDTLSRIAAASNMTLQQLLAKNPQIKDANKISVGQKINR